MAIGLGLPRKSRWLTLARLEKKLKSYVDLQIASGLAYRICFCFRHPRQAGARRVPPQATVLVATAAPSRHRGRTRPSGAPIGSERLRLAELAAMPIPPEPEERITETQAYRRRAEEERRDPTG